MKKFMIHTFICIIFIGLLLEIFFRFLLPASEWPRGVFSDSDIRRFDSTSFTEGKFTYGRYCNGGFEWSINNAGWNSIFIYESEIRRGMPMVAIMGDSYLEGFYSNVEQHVDVYLNELFADSVQFYTFAMSGGILSQYIALMKYEAEQYSPEAYVVFINSSDVVKSIREIGGRHPYYYQYSFDSLGVYTEEIQVVQSRSVYKDLILRSALVRYLRANAQVSLFGGGLVDENANDDELDVDKTVETVVSTELGNAAVFLLGELNSFDRPVLIVADCPKTWIYENGSEEAFEDVIALRECVDQFSNVSMLELSSFYIEEYAEHGLNFSVPENPHWNSYSNLFVARSIAPSILKMMLVNSELEN